MDGTGAYELSSADRERVAKLMESLPEREWARAKALDALRREIERDMQHNPSFQAPSRSAYRLPGSGGSV